MPRLIIALAVAICLAGSVQAQEADVRFGGLRQDTGLPVEVDAEKLSVDQAAGGAVFEGNVMVRQGEMRLTAARIQVEYGADGTGISRLHATGGVTLVSPEDAAEAQEAVYTIDTGIVVMTGNVLLTQGNAAISGEALSINLRDGTGTMTGRVKTVFTPGGKAP